MKNLSSDNKKDKQNQYFPIIDFHKYTRKNRASFIKRNPKLVYGMSFQAEMASSFLVNKTEPFNNI